ncbi:MAG: L-threonylcarbamoyladenylate synthase [Patescibacteria group bacterium]
MDKIMKILSKENLAEVAAELTNGQTIVFPTETSYGLGCDATNQKAVDKIFAIKKRPQTKSLLVVVPTIEMAKKYLEWNDLLEQLASKYWPGPLTIVGEYKNDQPTGYQLANGVVSTEKTLALRVTSHPVPKFLSEKISKPLVATSANISETESTYSAQEIIKNFSNQAFQPDIILDYGELPKNKPSTIVSVVGNELKILRQGNVQIV